MNRVAIAFNTCDRVDLTKRSIEPLCQLDFFKLWWVDGSRTAEGHALVTNMVDRTHAMNCRDVRGGSGPAIVYSLTKMLAHVDSNGKPAYDYIGLVENDVLLDADWFNPTMQLFERGREDGLEVGAVSARCYEDRILFQRDGYAVMHNLGAGMVVFSRKAAELVLQNYRTVWTTENRLLFSQLSGIDIGKYWAFRGESHFLVADWNFDRVLASHGLASLALTPNKITMLDQDIAPLGLKYAEAKTEKFVDDKSFEVYRDNLEEIRLGNVQAGVHSPFYYDGQHHIIFPHQIPQIRGTYEGDWLIRDFLGFGPFCWKSHDKTIGVGTNLKVPRLTVPVLGPCDILVSGGAEGGSVRVEDLASGYQVEPMLAPEDKMGVMQLSVPVGSAAMTILRLTALSPGVCFMGLKTREPQPYLPHIKFDYSSLPPP